MAVWGLSGLLIVFNIIYIIRIRQDLGPAGLDNAEVPETVPFGTYGDAPPERAEQAAP
jgi:hypothetical protein